MTNKFSTIPQEIEATLTQREKVLFPFFKKMNIMFFIFFTIITAVLCVIKQFIPVGGMLAGTVVFIFSLKFLYKGKMRIATWFATAGLFFAQFVCILFIDSGANPYVVYRMLAFAMFISLAQFLISTKLKEILFFQAATFLLAAFELFTLIPVISPEDKMTFYTSSVVVASAFAMSLSLLITNFNMITNFTTLLINEKLSINKAFSEISEIVRESKKGLETGQFLSENATTASTEAVSIQETFVDLKNASNQLSETAFSMTESFMVMAENAVEMKDNTASQNNAISESSAALTQIAANLSNINEITAQRSKNMNSLITSLGSQKTVIQEALTAVNDVKSSSSDISSFVTTVEEIANQTGLLAMNASIEAAHAGAQGKGFAVIAQEIRKLSEETSKNSTHIAEVLLTNEKTVEKAAESVTSFANQVDQNTHELQETMQSLEGILMGISEMNIGTRSVMNSLQEIVETSKHNETVVEDVSTKITEQKEIMSGVKEFIQTLENSVNKTETQIQSIQNVLNIISETSDKNIAMAETVNASLEAMNLQ